MPAGFVEMSVLRPARLRRTITHREVLDGSRGSGRTTHCHRSSVCLLAECWTRRGTAVSCFAAPNHCKTQTRGRIIMHFDRRDFLKSGAAFTVAAGLPQLASAQGAF